MKILFALTLLTSFSVSAANLDRVAAVVEDDPILQSDVERFKSQIERSRTLANIYKVDRTKLTAKDVLNIMIDERVVRSALKELGADVTDSEVDNRIAGIAKQAHLTMAQLEESLSQEGIPLEAYKRNTRAQLERQTIFARELRRGGGATESEIRSRYESMAKSEVHVSLISAKAVANLAAAKSDIAAKKLSVKQIEEKYPTDDMGWLGPDDMDEKLSQAVSSAKVGTVVGPVAIGGANQLVLVKGRRKGSEEEYKKMRTEISYDVESADSERRFRGWLDRKKKEMNIVINTL